MGTDFRIYISGSGRSDARFGSTIFALLLSLTLLALTADGQAALHVDAVGRSVDILASPRRIVSLAPSITETLFALGLDSEIVGVTMLSNYPEAANAKPRVGTFVNISLERVVSLNPDLVIGTADGNRKETVDQLEGMGIPVYVVDPSNLSEIFDMILSIGKITGRERQSEMLVEGLRARIARIALSVKKSDRPHVFMQIGISPIISVGSDTLHSELIDRAGGVNVYGETSTRYPRCSIEDIIVRQPDIIIVSSMKRGGDFYSVRDGWKKWTTIPAVRDGRIHIIDTDLIDHASPRIVDGLEKIAEIIHPDLFAKKR